MYRILSLMKNSFILICYLCGIPLSFICSILPLNQQRGRKRRSSDGSDDGHHSDGDYSEHDYRGDPADEKESKTIMLRGLPVNTTEADVSTKASLFMKSELGVGYLYCFKPFTSLGFLRSDQR